MRRIAANEKVGLVSKISFWGLILWFPCGIAFLFLVEQGVVSESLAHIIGDAFAVVVLFLTISLWLSCLIRLIQQWSNRSNGQNYAYLILLIFGTIIGSMIFYLIETRIKDNEAKIFK